MSTPILKNTEFHDSSFISQTITELDNSSTTNDTDYLTCEGNFKGLLDSYNSKIIDEDLRKLSHGDVEEATNFEGWKSHGTMSKEKVIHNLTI
jgi:hypothetical protein